ncbi:transposase [Kyrpidia spormannii]|uniref:Transposase n=1 Tax=Kyrpidia spormannii TaxID=2055160 RepID=A0A6F9EHR3_9BACL|nr:transposase [Kyrpidia spormannii]
MQVVYERCCGLDVHKRSVTACALTPEGKAVRTFGTMTEDLLELADWLKGQGCTHVAMESTGSFWKPIYNVLEATEAFTLLVVNAQHIKAVPGRKTDVKDAEWIADLLRHGLLQPSFIPSREQRELRELIRYRQELVDERAREANRIQKVLEGANIKLSSVATDILGKSGREILKALIEGQTDPEALADMAKGRMKAKREELRRAVQGMIGDHQRLLLREQLRHIEGGSTRTAGYDSRCRTTDRGGNPRRGRSRYRTLPQRCPLGLMGRDVSGVPRECGETEIGTHAQGQSHAQAGLGGGRSGSRTNTKHLSIRAVQTHREAAREQTSGCGGRAHDPGHCVLFAKTKDDLRRSRSLIL